METKNPHSTAWWYIERSFDSEKKQRNNILNQICKWDDCPILDIPDDCRIGSVWCFLSLYFGYTSIQRETPSDHGSLICFSWSSSAATPPTSSETTTTFTMTTNAMTTFTMATLARTTALARRMTTSLMTNNTKLYSALCNAHWPLTCWRSGFVLRDELECKCQMKTQIYWSHIDISFLYYSIS